MTTNLTTQPKPDPREEAWAIHRELCHMLSGDSVLIPFSEGEPDWSTTSRNTIEKVNDWADFEETDIPRLAILTDGFQRFIGKGEDVSVVTLWRAGTPIIQQIGGEPCIRAVDAIMDAVIDDIPLADVLPTADPRHEMPDLTPMERKLSEIGDRLAKPPTAANDNTPKKQEPAVREIGVINPAHWHGEEVPEREWYAADLIPMRQVTIISGDGGVGKSLLALQIGAAGCMGSETLGMTLLGGRTLYLGAEDEAEEFHRRLLAIVSAHGKTLADLEDFRLVPLAGMDALLAIPDNKGVMQPTPLWTSVEEYTEAFKPKLIVLDTVADLFGGDEIKRGQARQFISMLRHLAIKINCAVVLLAHPSVQGMQTGTGASGSTGWSNSSRSRLYMTRPDDKGADPDLRVLKTMKINYGKVGGQISIRWKDGSFELDDGKPAAGSMMLAARAEAVFRDLLSMFNRQGRSVCHVPGTTYAPAMMAKMPEAEGIPKARFVDAMNVLLQSGDIKIVVEGPPSRPRQRLILASEDFGGGD